MTGLHILIHSVQMILRNLRQVFQLGLIPLALASTGFAAIFGFLALQPTIGEGAMILAMIAVFGLVCVSMISFAVNWHRFVLLEEYPSGFVPVIRRGEMWRYFGYSIAIIFLVFLMTVPVLLGVGLLATLAFGMLPLIEFIATFLVTMGALRLGLILPAVSIGDSSSLSKMWGKTSGNSGALLVLAFFVTLLSLLAENLPTLLSHGAIGVAVAVVMQLFLLVLNISILTTLYGHYVEGRPVTG